MPIQILAPAVANQIAAGEVVERPASAVKELIENSLDAAATDIRVEIREGGQRLIRIQDDGYGIAAADTQLLFYRHATSKIASADDLDHLTTLGFRGEALASIASVSQITLLTCAPHETTGTMVRVDGGHEVAREGRGAPPGTTITVEHLFANIPARLKFLKQPATEAGHILQIVTRYALAYPGRRFSLVSDGKLTFQSTGSGKLYDVLMKVYGLEIARQMLPIGQATSQQIANGQSTNEQSAGLGSDEFARGTGPEASSADLRFGDLRIRVSGFIGMPSLHRSNRSYISLFVNRRWFQDNSLAYGVIQAYHTMLPVGRYPLALIFIEMDPAEVDVNVHPAKAEVRFRDGHAVFSAVQRAARATLTEHAPVPSVSIGDGTVPLSAAAVPAQLSWDDAEAWASRRQALLGAGHNLSQPQQDTEVEPDDAEEHERAWARPDPATLEGPPDLAAPRIPILRVIGQVAAMYIVAEGPDGMYLIDQHAAHERILYEQMLAAWTAHSIPVQPLLAPMVVELSPEQAAGVAQELEALRGLGLDLESFGGNTYMLRSLPAILSRDDPERAMAEIVDGLVERKNVIEGAHEARLVTLICKRAAIKGGQVLSMTEMQEMVRQLELCHSPRTCPHGRPTMVHVSATELARQFGRI